MVTHTAVVTAVSVDERREVVAATMLRSCEVVCQNRDQMS
jgi:hypothetical protein